MFLLLFVKEITVLSQIKARSLELLHFLPSQKDVDKGGGTLLESMEIDSDQGFFLNYYNNNCGLFHLMELRLNFYC